MPNQTPVASSSPKLRGVVLSVLMVAGLGACDRGDHQTPAQHLQNARTAMAAGQIRKAEIEAKNAVQGDAKNAEGRLLLADVFLALRRGADAEQEVNRAERLGATPDAVLPRRARAYLYQGEFNKVLDEVPANPAGYPDSMADLYELRGDAQLALGRLKEAMDAYNAELRVKADAPSALFAKARIHAMQGDATKSMELTDAGLAIAPNDALGLVIKGDLLLQAGDTPGALKSYQAAVDAHADDYAARLALASALITDGQYDAAQKHIDQVTRALPNYPSANYLNALLQFKQQRFKPAFDAIQKVLAALPDNPPALVLAAAIQYALDAPAQAEVNARRFVNAFPNNVYGRKLLAAIYLKAGQPDKAFEALKPVVDGNVSDAQAYTLAGNALIGMKDYPRALRYLSHAADIQPKDPTVQAALGYGQFVSGDVDRAIGSFESVLDLNATNSDAQTFLVLSLVGKGEYDKAIESTRTMLQKDPDNALLLNLLGGAYLAKKDLPAARDAFGRSLKAKPDYAPAAINLSKIAYGERRYDDARRPLLEVVKKDPRNLDALLALADLEAIQGHADESARWVDVAARENPTVLGPKIRQIRRQIDRQDYQRAANLARDVDGVHANNPEVLTLLAEAQVASGDRSGAVSTYGRLMSLDSKTIRYPLEVARIEAADNHLASAAGAIAKAIAIDPDSLEAQIVQAQINIRQGNFDAARDIAAKIQKRPGYAAAGLITAGDAWMAQKKADRAEKAYQSAFAAEKSSATVLKIQQSLVAQGKAKEADAVLKGWLAEHRDDAMVQLYAAAYYQSIGDSKQAEGLYRSIVARNPNDVVALNDLALLLHAKQDPKASSFAEQAVKVFPGSAQLNDTLGWILVDSGSDLQRGRDLLAKSATALPKNPEIRYHYAVALAKAGEKDKARTEIDAALSSTGHFAQEDDARKLREQL